MKKGLKILLVLMLFLYFPKVKAITITTDPSMTYGSGYQLVTNTGDFRVYIEGVGEYDNSQFAAYKIIDVYYNKSTDSLKYKFTANFQSFLNSSSTYNSVTIDSFFKEVQFIFLINITILHQIMLLQVVTMKVMNLEG